MLITNAATPELIRETADLSSRAIQAIAVRLTRPVEPLAEWGGECDEWIQAIQEFRRFEEENLYGKEVPCEA